MCLTVAQTRAHQNISRLIVSLKRRGTFEQQNRRAKLKLGGGENLMLYQADKLSKNTFLKLLLQVLLVIFGILLPLSQLSASKLLSNLIKFKLQKVSRQIIVRRDEAASKKLVSKRLS